MIRWIDRETFDELILTDTEASLNRMIDGARPVLDAVRRFIPEADLFYRIYHDESELTNHVERVYPGFRRNGILFFVIKYTYPKTYYDLHCDWSSFRYADNYSYGMAFDKQSEPNRIGVFTKRKIDDWVEYLTQGYRNLERIDAENERKITTFRRQLDSLPDVAWNHDRSWGSIKRNGLVYSFEIRATGYSEKISLDYGPRTLDDFLRLSDNKYAPHKQ